MNFFDFLQKEGKRVVKAQYEHVFMQGAPDRSLYFVQSGLLKAYYTAEDGKEFVKSFLLPQDIIGSLTSAYSEKSCSFSLVCLAPTELLEVPFRTLYEYSRSDHDIANEMIELLLRFAMKKERREFEFLCLSAEERYCLLAETSPILLEKVTQNDIARYLGVTPVALSRIKKRVMSPPS